MRSRPFTRAAAIAACIAAVISPVISQTRYDNPVIAGDFPDPSVIRVGSEYWATTTQTTSTETGVFPLFVSKDLVHWARRGNVLGTPPAWTAGSYWAPEISRYRDRFFVYYSALCNKADPACSQMQTSENPHCIGVAVAADPGGPYTDNGKPLVCEQLGAIDPVAFTTSGRRYLLWKEDANSCPSCRVPSRIWAQELSGDGGALIGDKTELLRSENGTWERGTIEGPFVLRHGGYFYLFYSGALYGGVDVCNYRLGVARSTHLLGPYSKDPANPLLSDNRSWKCPGHGSIVMTPNYHWFLLHHAFPLMPARQNIREVVLDEITWKADGWPVINDNRGTSAAGEVQ